MKNAKPSSTAWLIGAATLLLSHHPRLWKLVPTEALEPTRACLRGAGGWRSWTVGLFRRRWFQRYAQRLEKRSLEGFVLHIAARKKYLEEAVRRAIAEGFKQVIILGAGYDTLAQRLHKEFPRIVFIEIDHPATQRVKLNKALTRDLPSPTLALVGADLGKQDLREALAGCTVFKAAADTVFVAEGLLMYLEPKAVEALLASIRAQGGRRCRMAFTFLEPQPGGTIGFPKASASVDRWLERHGEPFVWGVTRENLPAWLAERGFNLLDVAGPQTFRQRVLAGLASEEDPLAAGEFAAVAERR